MPQSGDRYHRINDDLDYELVEQQGVYWSLRCISELRFNQRAQAHARNEYLSDPVRYTLLWGKIQVDESCGEDFTVEF